MSWSAKLAKEFNNRNNEFKIGAIIGVVKSVSPLQIVGLSDSIIINEDNSNVCNAINELIKKGQLSNGDSVLVLASESNSVFFIVDKIGG